MGKCQGCKKCQSEAVPENVVKAALAEIKSLLLVEGPAADYASSQEVYEQLLVAKKRGFFVSEEHVADPDMGRTFYAVADDEEAYQEFIKDIDRQHLPGGLTPGLSPAEALRAEEDDRG